MPVLKDEDFYEGPLTEEQIDNAKVVGIICNNCGRRQFHSLNEDPFCNGGKFIKHTLSLKDYVLQHGIDLSDWLKYIPVMDALAQQVGTPYLDNDTFKKVYVPQILERFNRK